MDGGVTERAIPAGSASDRNAFAGIGILSASLLGFLFWLLYFRQASPVAPAWTVWLPSVNAALNFSSALLLVCGVLSIRTGRRDLHMRFMLAAVAVAALFLSSYIVYHHYHGDTRFTGEGAIRIVYFVILVTHIVGSIVAVPLVLTTLMFARSKRFDRHRRIARVTFPLWLYVSVTGVAVFFFLKLWG